jgi:hypothetical protein
VAKQTIKLGENEAEIDSLSEDEVKGILETALDDRLSKLTIPDAVDTDKLKTDILGEVTSLFEKHQNKPMDEDAFFKRFEKTFNDGLGKALKGVGNGNKEKTPGPLSRFLSG